MSRFGTNLPAVFRPASAIPSPRRSFASGLIDLGRATSGVASIVQGLVEEENRERERLIAEAARARQRQERETEEQRRALDAAGRNSVRSVRDALEQQAAQVVSSLTDDELGSIDPTNPDQLRATVSAAFPEALDNIGEDGSPERQAAASEIAELLSSAIVRESGARAQSRRQAAIETGISIAEGGSPQQAVGTMVALGVPEDVAMAAAEEGAVTRLNAMATVGDVEGLDASLSMVELPADVEARLRRTASTRAAQLRDERRRDVEASVQAAVSTGDLASAMREIADAVDAGTITSDEGTLLASRVARTNDTRSLSEAAERADAEAAAAIDAAARSFVTDALARPDADIDESFAFGDGSGIERRGDTIAIRNPVTGSVSTASARDVAREAFNSSARSAVDNILAFDVTEQRRDELLGNLAARFARAAVQSPEFGGELPQAFGELTAGVSDRIAASGQLDADSARALSLFRSIRAQSPRARIAGASDDDLLALRLVDFIASSRSVSLGRAAADAARIIRDEQFSIPQPSRSDLTAMGRVFGGGDEPSLPSRAAGFLLSLGSNRPDGGLLGRSADGGLLGGGASGGLLSFDVTGREVGSFFAGRSASESVAAFNRANFLGEIEILAGIEMAGGVASQTEAFGRAARAVRRENFVTARGGVVSNAIFQPGELSDRDNAVLRITADAYRLEALRQLDGFIESGGPGVDIARAAALRIASVDIADGEDLGERIDREVRRARARGVPLLPRSGDSEEFIRFDDIVIGSDPDGNEILFFDRAQGTQFLAPIDSEAFQANRRERLLEAILNRFRGEG